MMVQNSGNYDFWHDYKEQIHKNFLPVSILINAVFKNLRVFS